MLQMALMQKKTHNLVFKSIKTTNSTPEPVIHHHHIMLETKKKMRRLRLTQQETNTSMAITDITEITSFSVLHNSSFSLVTYYYNILQFNPLSQFIQMFKRNENNEKTVNLLQIEILRL